ncbi:MAG: hypothetical protein IK093_18095 [Ruminiclostridium sp.]|nr:hypothetical protein [Ruminiclostridium sp.]
MAKLELLTVSMALRALIEDKNADKALELVNELLGAVRKLPPGQKLELLTLLFAVKTLLEGDTPDKAVTLIDGILAAMKTTDKEGD